MLENPYELAYSVIDKPEEAEFLSQKEHMKGYKIQGIFENKFDYYI